MLASPLAKTPYDLRHACVSTLLNGGVAPTQVAEWAGHSLDVLLKIYAEYLDGQDVAAKKRIKEALGWGWQCANHEPVGHTVTSPFVVGGAFRCS